MNILLDECVDRRLARDLVGHLVSTVPKMGWAGIKNGALLALAEKEFEAFVTVDRKISVEHRSCVRDRSRHLQLDNVLRAHSDRKTESLERLREAVTSIAI